MLLLAPNGELSPRVKSDPRWSGAQVEAARKAAEADTHAHVLGLDQKMRPVIRAKFDGARGPTQYALLRNGDPAKPVMPLVETWRSPRHR